MDDTYAIPTKEWVLGEYALFYKSFLERMGTPGWRDDFDCDNFAAVFWTMAQCGHARAMTKKQGIAIGMFGYQPDGAAAGHAINVAVTDKGVIFVEPQSCKEVFLTKTEALSCSLALF